MIINKIDTIIIKTDGAARGNPGPAGIGALVSDSAGRILEEACEYIGEATNNVAEYKALIFGLRMAAAYKVPSIRIYLDSELVVNQLNGVYKVKNAALKVFYSEAKTLIGRYAEAFVGHIPRTQNSIADRLANEAIEKFLAGEIQEKPLTAAPDQGSLF